MAVQLCCVAWRPQRLMDFQIIIIPHSSFFCFLPLLASVSLASLPLFSHSGTSYRFKKLPWLIIYIQFVCFSVDMTLRISGLTDTCSLNYLVCKPVQIGLVMKTERTWKNKKFPTAAHQLLGCRKPFCYVFQHFSSELPEFSSTISY